MKQQTLSAAADREAGLDQHREATGRDAFRATMDDFVSWKELCPVIEPHFPKVGNGRPPIGLERMLRMDFLQQSFNLADEACEDALLDSTALCRFMGSDLEGEARVPRDGQVDGARSAKNRIDAIPPLHCLNAREPASVGIFRRPFSAAPGARGFTRRASDHDGLELIRGEQESES